MAQDHHLIKLKQLAEAVGDKLEIILDGGIRRGTHVLKALAAGATACSFGKMFLFALGAGGQQGLNVYYKTCMMKSIEIWY